MHDNSLGLSKRIGKTQGLVYKHLKVLQKENYIISTPIKKNAFMLNYQTLFSQFTSFVLKEPGKYKFQLSPKNSGLRRSFLFHYKEDLKKKPEDFFFSTDDLKDTIQDLEKRMVNNSLMRLFFNELMQNISTQQYVTIEVPTLSDLYTLICTSDTLSKYIEIHFNQLVKKSEFATEKADFVRFFMLAHHYRNFFQEEFLIRLALEKIDPGANLNDYLGEIAKAVRETVKKL